jgi:hypothetical protein
MEDFTLPSVGASFKKCEYCAPILSKGLAHSSNFPKKTFKKYKNIKRATI